MARNIISSVSLSLAFCLTICATVSAQQFEWFDVEAFDVDLVQTSTGQIFHDMVDNIDMVATGDVRGDIKVLTNDIVATNDLMETTCFTFMFESDVHIFLKVHSLDDQEVIKIGTYGDPAYIHSEGAAPSVGIQYAVDTTAANLPQSTVARPNIILLRGDGRGFEADGAARGFIDLGVSHVFSWCYTPQSDQKSEAFSIGRMIVPEPSSTALITLGLIAMLCRRRK